MQKTKINRSDLKIFPSERLTDNDDGGGMPLGKAINGVANELFNPISSIARVNGGFFLRKIFMGVQRADNEPLIGGFTAITRPPTDESVSYLMFEASKFGESRGEIIKRIESFSVPSIESRMTLYANQLRGGRMLLAYQNVGEPLPNVGDVFCLWQTKAGYPNIQQFVQISRISSETRTFSNSQKSFEKQVIKLELTQSLNHDFVGIDYPQEGYANSPCRLYDTTVADIAKYYGVKALAQAISLNDKTLKLNDIMERLVPTNIVENALVDINASQRPIDVSGKSVLAPVQSYIEYVQTNNRSYDYTAQLINPKKGSVVAKYLAQGTWYELKDDGNGKLVGASTLHGSGRVDYATGSATINCGQIPDVDSAVVVNYLKDVYQSPKADLATYLPINIDKIATNITVSQNGKTGKVVGNQITGEITGSYDMLTGILKIDPTIERDNIVVDYTYGIPITGTNQSTQVVNDKVEFVTYGFAKGTLIFTAVFNGASGFSRKIYHDNGLGKLIDETGQTVGSVDYDTGKVSFNQKVQVIEQKPIYETVQVGSRSYEIRSGNTVSMHFEPIYEQKLIRYDTINEQRTFSRFDTFSLLQTGNTTTKETFNQTPLVIAIGTDLFDIVAFSFYLNDTLYHYDNGKILQGEKQVGTRQGNVVMLTDFVMAKAVLNDLLIKTADDDIKQLVFTTPKLRPASLKLNIDGKLASSTVDGKIMLDGSQIGTVNSGKGLVHLYFDNKVKAVVYQAVALSYLPVDNEVVKIDTVRLPPDGRVPIFRRGDTILISNTQTQNLGSAFTANQTVQLERNDLDRICLQDSHGKAVLADLWQYDLQAGSITFAQSLDLSDYAMPLIAKHTQEEKNRVLAVDIDGTLSLQFATKRAYGLDDTFVSSVLIGGDLQVNVSVPFTQRSWNNVWQDTPVGEQLLNKLNVKDYPIVLTDDGAIDERWLIKWTSSSQFELYGETVGFVMKTDTLQDLAPINPATKKPYFTIPKQAFGNDAPWAVGDVIRFNTDGTLMPVWVLCAVQPTANPLNEEDGFTVCLFGDTTEI